MKKRSIILTALVCAALLLPLGSQVFAQAEQISKFTVEHPLDMTVFNPVAESYFHITGTYVIKMHELFDGDGKYHGKGLFKLENATAIDLASGEEYRAHGTENGLYFNYWGLPFVHNYTANWIFNSKGNGDNYLWKTKCHITINANGDVVCEIYSDYWK